MTKFSGITPNASPALADYLVGVTAGGVDDRVTIQNLINLFNVNNVIKPGGISWPDFTGKNIKGAQNTSAPALSSADLDLASCGLSLSFTMSGAGVALVTVVLGINSTSDWEFRPEIRLGGAIQFTASPAAAIASASGRAQVRSIAMPVNLVNGVNTISAGVFLTAGAGYALPIGAGSIAAVVFGNVTA